MTNISNMGNLGNLGNISNIGNFANVGNVGNVANIGNIGNAAPLVPPEVLGFPTVEKSPALIDEFSSEMMKSIVDSIKDEGMSSTTKPAITIAIAPAVITMPIMPPGSLALGAQTAEVLTLGIIGDNPFAVPSPSNIAFNAGTQNLSGVSNFLPKPTK